MGDYIDRQAVVNVICDMHIGGKDGVANALPNTYGADLREIIEQIDSLPSADVEPVRHGRWVIRYGDGHTEKALTGGECSECGFVNTATKYCPNCGARMDGD